MKEHMLQLLWKSHIGNIPEITALSGLKVYVLNSGTFNTGDGPDFLNAKIRTSEGIILHGSIEIHTNEQDWFLHKHHTDSLYNNVILHVVLNSGKFRVHTKDGFFPETLVVKSLIHFGSPGYSYTNQSLPCTGAVQFISKAVVLKQFEQSRNAYFQELKERLLTFWDASLPLSEAWRNVFCMGFADGLGISMNRQPMQRLAALLLETIKSSGEIPSLEKGFQLSGLVEGSETNLKSSDWHKKGGRPANSPKNRIPELHYFLKMLFEINLSSFRSDYDSIWKKLTLKKGKRTELLYHIVYLPALYLLGELVADESLKSNAYRSWKNHSIELQQSILAYFSKAGISVTAVPQHLGAVYQMKHVCMKQQCERCLVFKAIASGS